MDTFPEREKPTQVKRKQFEPIGKRIAQLRQEHGWTQQALAARLAISRVAISHIEMDLTLPGERTITLLAGLFKISPHELVEGTTYPQAKAERLPHVACAYTPLEMELALIENDLAWLERLASTIYWSSWVGNTWEKWNARLLHFSTNCVDEREKELIAVAWKKLAAACQSKS